MKLLRWLIGTIVLGMVVWTIIIHPMPFLFNHDLEYVGFFGRTLYILILASLLCLYRVLRGPTAVDRIISVDILGIMIVGLCTILSISTGRSWYIDIGIAWALQGFISILALSKYLEGKGFDE